MNTDQSNHLDMYNAVIKHCTDNQPITDTILAFKNGITALTVKVTSIQTTAAGQEEIISGEVLTKEELHEILIQITFSTIQPVKAYAASTNNHALEKKMDYSLSDLRRILDDKIALTAQNLLNIVNPLVPSLADYGITPANITAWQTAINNYKLSVSKPRVAVVHRKTLTAELVTLFSQASHICTDTLDPLAENFKTPQPHYYSDYKSCREIINLGTAATRVIGICTDQLGNPIYAVAAKINELDLTALSDVAGNYAHEDPTPSTCTMTFSKSGFTPITTAPFEIKSGQTITKDITLAP